MNRILPVFCYSLLTALFLASALHAEEAGPLDYKFREAIEGGEVSAAEVLRRLKTAVTSLEKADDLNSLYFADIYAMAIKRATGAEREKLVDLLSATPATSYSFARIYGAAIKHSRGSELDKFAELLRAMPADAISFDECFSVYVTAMIRERVAELKKKPIRVRWKQSAEPMPKELADAPASLRDAWRLYASVMAPYEALARPP